MSLRNFKYRIVGFSSRRPNSSVGRESKVWSWDCNFVAVKSNSNGLCGFVGLWIITRQPEHILLQMDPITIVSAVAAAAQLAGSTASIGLKLFRFYCNVKDAPRKSKELCEEISELSAVIENLSQILTELGNSEIVNV